ncbi:MAG: D-alanyl-D-alanine carboxypeptidase [Subtercola sp.]|nr:D-alanyl-D-alanine carboxypeptidase [Subtercola sp.]
MAEKGHHVMGLTLRIQRTAIACAALLALAGCATGAGASGQGASGSPVASPGSDNTGAADAFDAEMSAPVAAWRTSFQASSMTISVPGTVVAASVGDAGASLVASGDAVLGSQPISVDAAFHIGSMTKLFTAALIMQLDQEGVLSLNDTIGTWFPSAPNASTITVLELLQHESGLYELDMGLVGVATHQQVIENVFAQAPIAAPGTSYQYLNAGYVILGRIAELASGTSYDQLVQTRFISKLGLTGTYLDGYGSGAAALTGYDLGCVAGSGSDCLGKPSKPQATAPVPSPQWSGAWAAAVWSARLETRRPGFVTSWQAT